MVWLLSFRYSFNYELPLGNEVRHMMRSQGRGGGSNIKKPTAENDFFV